jgi:hypothetical protein
MIIAIISTIFAVFIILLIIVILMLAIVQHRLLSKCEVLAQLFSLSFPVPAVMQRNETPLSSPAPATY